MTERDIFFLAMTAILATTLVVFVWQFIRSRRGGDDRGNWWQGPWDDDEKR